MQFLIIDTLSSLQSIGIQQCRVFISLKQISEIDKQLWPNSLYVIRQNRKLL